MAYMLNFEISS